MATYKPELHSIEAVMSYFDQYDEPGYQVFAGHKPDAAYCRFTYSGNDKGIGREKLLEALQSVANNPDNTNTYLLQIMNQKGRKFEPVNSITFQLNKANQNIYPAIIGGIQNNAVNNEILSRLRAMDERLAMLETDPDEEEDEEEEEEPDFISGLLNNPAVKQNLMNVMMNIFSSGGQKPQAVAGVPENAPTEAEKISAAIEVLQKNTTNLGDKLLKLAQMSMENPQQYYWLVKMLDVQK